MGRKYIALPNAVVIKGIRTANKPTKTPPTTMIIIAGEKTHSANDKFSATIHALRMNDCLQNQWPRYNTSIRASAEVCFGRMLYAQ